MRTSATARTSHGSRQCTGLSLWIATIQRMVSKPEAAALFQWLRQASEGTFLRSPPLHITHLTEMDDLEMDWPALLAGVLECSILSCCSTDVATALLPTSSHLLVQPKPHRISRRTTRGKGRYIQKSQSLQNSQSGAHEVACMWCCSVHNQLCTGSMRLPVAMTGITLWT